MADYRKQHFYIQTTQNVAGNQVLKVDFPIGGIQLNNTTNAVFDVYHGSQSLGVGAIQADYSSKEFTFLQAPLDHQVREVTLDWNGPSSQFDAVHVILTEEILPFDYKSNPPNTVGQGPASNVTIVGSLPTGANPIGSVTIGIDNTDIAKGGAPITGQTLTTGSGVLGWLSQIVATLKGILTVNVNASLPAGSNHLGEVAVNSLPALATGTNIIGSAKLSDGTNSVGVLATGELKVANTQPLPSGGNSIGSVVVSSMPPVQVSSNPVRNSHSYWEGNVGTAEIIIDLTGNANGNVNEIDFIDNSNGTSDLFVSYDTVTVTTTPSTATSGTGTLNGVMRIPAGTAINDIPRQCSKIHLIKAVADGKLVRFMGV